MNRKIAIGIYGMLVFVAGLIGGVALAGSYRVMAIDLPNFDFLRQLFQSRGQQMVTSTRTLPVVSSPPAISTSAEAYEAQIVAAVERAEPSVVSVIVTKDLPVIEQYFINPFEDFGLGFPFRFQFQVPEYRQRGTEKREVGGGTGFVISSDGLILTNNHVVSDTDAEYTVLLNDGSKLTAKVLGRDAVLDLAVLRVERKDLTPLALGNSDDLKIGQTVIAIGNALGEFRNTVSVGVVSGLGRNIEAGDGRSSEVLHNVIQTDAAINRGNSGGPLLNLRGEVIGVNVAMVSGAQNIGFAIPVNSAKRIIREAIETGKITLPFIGVRYQILTKELSKEKKLSVEYGALLVSSKEGPAVEKNSPADRAGLREGDVILEVNGERITTKNPLSLIVRKFRAGEVVTLKVLRGTEILTFRITLGERP